MIIGIQDQVQLRGVQVFLVACGRGRRHPISVVEEQAEVAQPSDTGLRAHRRQPDLNPGVAQVALLGLARLVIEVDLFVRAAGHALPPTSTTVLVHQNNAILGAFVDRA
jgi:hypothetical protein